MAKIFSVLTLLVALGATFLGFQSKDLVEKLQVAAKAEHEDLLATRKTLEITKKKLKDTEEELARTKSELETTKATLAETRTKLEATETELTTTKGKLAEAEGQLASIKKQLEEILGGGNPDDLKKQITDMKNKVTDLEGKVATLEKEKAELTTTVETLTAQRKDNEATIADQKKNLDRYRNNIMQKGIRGQVLAVNPGWGFCVISVGDRAGAAPNKIMIVARGGQAIGKVKIVNVEKTQSVADILPGSFVRGAYVQPGDEVIYTGDDKIREEPVPPVGGNTTPPVVPPQPPGNLPLPHP